MLQKEKKSHFQRSAKFISHSRKIAICDFIQSCFVLSDNFTLDQKEAYTHKIFFSFILELRLLSKHT